VLPAVRLLRRFRQGLVGHAEVLDGVPSEIRLRQAGELGPVAGGADRFAEVDVHPGVAAGEDAVIGLAVLEFDHLLLVFFVWERGREGKGVSLREKERSVEVRSFFDRDGGGPTSILPLVLSLSLKKRPPFLISSFSIISISTHHGVRLSHLEQEEREHCCFSFRAVKRKRESTVI
jgi:hypothetical protein